jgi:hypothetical protein
METKAIDLLPVASVAVIGPALVIAAVQSEDALPMWGRIAMAAVGVGAIGLGIKAMLDEPAGGSSAMSQLAVGAQRELEHTKDAATAIKIAMDHLKVDPDYYVKLAKAGL